ncbi:MAG TPA: IMP dehydrogenase, partial [Firmicutes bacterium]|nr:IMP dehydrogenase [Bacillota bacterium]
LDAGADMIVVDTAHGHSRGVIDTIRAIRASFGRVNVMAGNVATGEAVRALAEAGADCVKVGIGP